MYLLQWFLGPLANSDPCLGGWSRCKGDPSNLEDPNRPRWASKASNGSFQKEGPRNKAQYTMILVVRTPQKGPLIFGTPNRSRQCGLDGTLGRPDLILYFSPIIVIVARPEQQQGPCQPPRNPLKGLQGSFTGVWG